MGQLSKAARSAAAKARANVKSTMLAKRQRGRAISIGAAGAAGYIEGRAGEKVPYSPKLGLSGTYGLVLGAVGLVTGQEAVMDAATGMLSAAAWNLGMEQGIEGKLKAAKAEGGADAALEGDDWEVGDPSSWDEEVIAED